MIVRKLVSLVYRKGKQAGTFGYIKQLMPPLQRRYIRAILEHHFTDIYLISYPKCGRTWLRHMMGCSLAGHFDRTTNNPLDLKELSTSIRQIPTISVTHDGDPHKKAVSEIETDKSKYRNKKVIFLVRNPRDVVVSMYFEKTRRSHLYDAATKVDSDATETLRHHALGEVGGLRSVIRVYNVWYENRHVPRDFMVVTYEGLHQSPNDELKRILSFIGLSEVSEATIREAVERSSFDNMRKLEQHQSYGTYRLEPGNRLDLESYKTRAGEVGGYIRYLDRSTIDTMNRIIREEMSPFYQQYL